MERNQLRVRQKRFLVPKIKRNILVKEGYGRGKRQLEANIMVVIYIRVRGGFLFELIA